MPASDMPRPSTGGTASAAISNLIVRLFSQYTGRGPTKARTIVNEDMITVVLQDTLTRAEITLVEKDYQPLVLLTRRTFQDVMGDEMIAGVEEVTGRTVIAFLSANHIDPDIAVETFLLAPIAPPGLVHNADAGEVEARQRDLDPA
ncbi:MAG TPA: Na-translocating system protein MpsC family protein [Solirubrobacteraceae bacterium]|nr:Na-translocating system protein MpsC family protein [Solirubrobacteraceae bacterium]